MYTMLETVVMDVLLLVTLQMIIMLKFLSLLVVVAVVEEVYGDIVVVAVEQVE